MGRREGWKKEENAGGGGPLKKNRRLSNRACKWGTTVSEARVTGGGETEKKHSFYKKDFGMAGVRGGENWERGKLTKLARASRRLEADKCARNRGLDMTMILSELVNVSKIEDRGEKTGGWWQGIGGGRGG